MTLPSPNLLGPIWGLSEFCLSLLKRSKAGAASKDRHSLQLIWAVTLTAMALAIFLAFHLPSWRFPWPGPFYIAGFGLFGFGLFLRWYSIIFLGRFFTVNVAIAADHRLIDTGPYRFLRHPSYTGSMIMVLGFGLCLGNLASLLMILVPCVGVTLHRIRIEEAALLGAFGERYRAYMQTTKRLIPFVY